MQVIDLARLSLAEFSERAGYYAPVLTSRRRSRHDIVDALRTVYWYHGVQEATQIFSARGLERRFEPEAFWVSEHGENLRRNKWSKYRVGRHVPSEVIVAKVETKFPASRRDLNHPLWALLSEPSGNGSLREINFRLLDLEVQQVVQRRVLSSKAKQKGTWTIDGHVTTSLGRRASLDALAAIIFLLRDAYEKNQIQAAHEWGRELYRMMILVGHKLLKRNIAMPLFELIEKRVMPLTEFGGRTYVFPASRFLNAIAILDRSLQRLEGLSYALMSEQQKNAHRLEILNGKYGFDHLFALAPVLTASPASAILSEQEMKHMADDQNMFTWAWNMLDAGGHRSAPPAAAMRGDDLWARATSDDD